MSAHRRARHRAPNRFRNPRVLTVTSTLAFLAVGVVGAPIASEVINTSAETGADRASVTAPASYEEALSEHTHGDEIDVNVDKAVAVAKQKSQEPLPDLSKMTLPQLQTYAAKMQAEFVQASLAYEAAETQADQAEVAAEEAEIESEAAEAEAEAVREAFAAQVISTYESGVLDNPAMQAFVAGADNMGEFLETYQSAKVATEAGAITVTRMQEARDAAAEASARAAAAREEAADAQSDAQVLLNDIQGRAAKVAAAANKALSNSSNEALFASAEQTARNKAALASWRKYLDLLDQAKVVPPPAAALVNARKLPRGLEPLLGATGEPVAGVAAKKFKGQSVTVLPRETIATVSQAFSAVGKPYVAGNNGPDTYDCSGLAAAGWADTPYEIPASAPAAQFSATKVVSEENAQVGDLVFFTAKDAGIQHVGINLGGDLMLTADASSHQVGVQQFPKKVYAVTRATLPASGTHTVPDSAEETPLRCGGSETAGNGMLYPLEEGTYRYSATFGQAGHMWSSGYHTGLDFSAPAGTAVMAAKAGTVRVEASAWAGPQHVIIDHGDGLETAYAHMQSALVKTGDVVSAGQLIGAVGSEGNSSGPHLHFEVLVGGVKVDPMLFLSSDAASGSGGWGGFSNGMIPDENLCPLPGAPGHMLRCDAASAFAAMATAYKKAQGTSLCITDSYRSYAAQVTLYGVKPALAAVPGTSNHGWALAVDLCGGIESFGTKQHQWMVQNASKFGWVLPRWARQGGGREEPWHWEFGNIS